MKTVMMTTFFLGDALLIMLMHTVGFPLGGCHLPAVLSFAFAEDSLLSQRASDMGS